MADNKVERWISTPRDDPKPDFLTEVIYRDTDGMTIAYADLKDAELIVALHKAAIAINPYSPPLP